MATRSGVINQRRLREATACCGFVIPASHRDVVTQTLMVFAAETKVVIVTGSDAVDISLILLETQTKYYLLESGDSRLGRVRTFPGTKGLLGFTVCLTLWSARNLRL
jgi:hypothetical protein